MALQLALTNTLVGADFPNGYARVSTIAISRQRGGGHNVMIDVVIYAQSPNSEDVREVDFKRFHTPIANLPNTGGLIQRAYDWLKTQPEFAVAVDV